MKRVLVTGAGGFIGRYVLAPLMARGYEVHATSSWRDGDGAGVKWHRVNLLDSTQTCALVDEVKPSHLLHLAWYTKHGKYWTESKNLRWVQASLGLVLRFAEMGGGRVVCAGTCAEYDWRFGYCSEGITPIQPATLYGTSKAGLWQILESFAKVRELSLGWARIFFPYGPHEAGERLLPSVINGLLRGEKVACTLGAQVRDFIYVQDAADALVTLLDSRVEGPVNIGSGEPIAIKQLVAHVADTLNGTDLVEFGAIPMRDNEPPLLVADIRRLRNEVGLTSRYSLGEGLKQTIDWWRHNPAKGDAQ